MPSESTNSEPVARSTTRSIHLISVEGIPFAIMAGLTEPFIVPYALAMGAGAFEAGLLASFRNLVLSWSQLATVRTVHWFRSRRRTVLWAVSLQAVLFVPIAFARPLFGPWAVMSLVVLYTLGSTSAALGGPAWGSLASEQLPQARRGEFFGRREMLVGVGTAAAGVLGGAILQAFGGRPLLGFGLLCIIASVSRGWSWIYLAKLEDRPWREPREARVSFVTFLGRARSDNFVRFALGFGLFNLCVHVTVPYLTVYMLSELKYSYLTYSIVVLSGVMLGNIMIPRWGRIGDARGNRVVLRWTMAGASFLPFFWILSPHPGWLLLMHLVGGIVWGGLNLAAVNFVYDATSESTRPRNLAYFNVLAGSSVGLGAIVGGAILPLLPPIGGSAFLSLFVFSGGLRCLATVLFEASVREVRAIHQVGLREVMLDFVGLRLVQVLGYFSVKPGQERLAAREARSTGDTD